MNPPKAPDWKKKALRAGVTAAAFGLIFGLLYAGIDWFVSGTTTKTVRDFVWVMSAAFVTFYFNSAIDSIHERLSEIAEGCQSQQQPDH